MKWTSRHLLNLVQANRHAPPEWAFYRELASATGAWKGRTFDGWAMHLWPSQKYRMVGYEAKISRADFARELAEPAKRGALEEVTAECWFLTPARLVAADEVPAGWGLVEAYEDGKLRTVKMPTQRPTPELPTAFWASVARRSADGHVNLEVAILNGRTLRLDHLNRLVEAKLSKRIQDGKVIAPDRDPYSAEPTQVQRRERLHWIETELRSVLGWGATTSAEVLRERLAELAAGGLTPERRRWARESVRELGRMFGMELPEEPPRRPE